MSLKYEPSSEPLHISAKNAQTAPSKLHLFRLLFKGTSLIRNTPPSLGQPYGPRHSGGTPLHFFSQSGNEPVVRRLLFAGADIAAQDNDGKTPLHRAVRWDHVAVAKMLLDAKADVSAEDKQGEQALHAAAAFGHSASVHLLLEWSPLELGIVRLHGLVVRADINGETGKVTSFDQSTSRFTMRLKSGQLLAVIAHTFIFLRSHWGGGIHCREPLMLCILAQFSACFAVRIGTWSAVLYWDG